MRIVFTLLLVIFFIASIFSQSTIEKALKQFNTKSVPYISIEKLKKDTISVLLDTRKEEEFNVSRLQNAEWVGHKTFEISNVIKQYPEKDTPIIVYCSIGVRSEDIGEQLLKAGYTNVKNLYGGIFEWINNENPVFDSDGNKTEKVHAFSKHWGKLLTKGDKIYSSKLKRP